MRRLIAVLLVWLMPQMALAQSAASLVADSITIPPGGTQLIASGNVEVFFEDTRLSARRIIFDQTTDRLIMEGPIFIVAGDGTLFTADQADLDPRLENGILRGARLVLNEQLQLGANRIDRVDGRYTQLSQVAVTSCHVCAEGETPLWEIRAREIIHDEAARQLYFEGASFRVAGVPIFWLPQMRLPDPTLTRATGVLTPRIRSSDILGFGVKLPYFIRLGDHRDLTLTPYLSSSTTTLEALYRQAYLRGELRIEAAASQDDLTDRTRAYVFADGIFDLGDDVILRFDIEYASDDTYLLDYGYSDKDRLDSELSFERVRDRDLTRARLTYYSSLRDGEPSETLPPLLADVQWERRVSADWGGTYTFTSDMQAHYRDISDPVLGRDVARLGFGTGWQNSWTTDYGLVVEATTGFDLDYYTIGNDPTFDDTLRTTTYAATTLRYPMIRETASATHVIEPIVHLAWSNVSGDAVPNEDSNATEFDQTNLFALSRFSGEDAVEEGRRAALGLTWTRIGAGGWDSTLTLGRVFRDESATQFSTSSGLSTTTSDWLFAGQLRMPDGLSIEARLVFDDTLDITKSEVRGAWDRGKLDLSASYIFLPGDIAEFRPDTVSEWTIDADYRFNGTWTAGVEARYDVQSSGPSRTALEIGWRNECVQVDFSVSRRFTSSTTLDPSTDYDLSIDLLGFGGSPAGSVANPRCSN